MKFWQLLDIFRDEKELLKRSFQKGNWVDLSSYYDNIEEVVINQRRDILDKEVDERLLYDVCRESKKVIFYSQFENKIYSYRNSSDQQQFSIKEAISLFDHDSLEEVFEKTEAVAKRLE